MGEEEISGLKILDERWGKNIREIEKWNVNPVS